MRRWPTGVRLMAWILFGAVALYALWLTYAVLDQERLIFPGAYFVSPEMDAPPSANAQVIRVDLDGGDWVEGWFEPVLDEAGRPAPVVVFFHGNLDLLDEAWGDVASTYRSAGYGVFVLEYRGYGRCPGRPSESASIAGSVRLIDALRSRSDVGPLIYHGNSLGGAIAIGAAIERPPAAIVLEATFISMERMAWRKGVPGWLCRHPFRSDERIAQVDCPILIVHGRDDELIPIADAYALQKLARDARVVVTDQPHMPYRTAFEPILGFLRATVPPRSTAP